MERLHIIERDEILRGDGPPQPPPDEPVELVRRQPAVRRRLDRDVLGRQDVAYVGNDVNDADCLRAVGVPVVPADAWPEVRGLAAWVLSRPGGAGCVREFCDGVWEAQRG